MRYRPRRALPTLVIAIAVFIVPAASTAQAPPQAAPPSTAPQGPAASRAAAAAAQDFPEGTATSSELCGACHQAIYREFSEGFGADFQYGEVLYESPAGKKVLGMPAKASVGTLHSISGAEPFPIHARTTEEEARSCNVCHFPQAFEIPDMNVSEIAKPKPRPKAQEAAGLTCASCHLTPSGKIRGPYDVTAPHGTVREPKLQTSAMCANCHALGTRVSGKQTQTFFEWREDFFKPGLGRQHCQDCHMPKTQRKLAEDFEVPVRAVARHLWTGGHSPQRVRTALNMVVVQAEEGRGRLDFHVINVGAGHSVPTGSNRRGVYLRAEVTDGADTVVAHEEWLFAPWYGDRPDDRKFLEDDKKRPDAIAVTQADAQGPHEAPIRAGEERILSWRPKLPAGSYTVRARLVYDLNRYNDPKFTGDQTEIYRTSLAITVAQ
jgi:hypothetical protein